MEERYLLQMGGFILLGLITLVLTAFLVFLVLPFIDIVILGAFGIFVVFLIFVVVWAFLWMLGYIGVAIYYAITKPVKVKKSGSYTLKNVKESGRRKKTK